MLNKAFKAQKEEVRRAEEEKLCHLLGNWDVGEIESKIVEYKGVKYRVDPVWVTVVDDYDEEIGSVELSHRHSLGFSYITEYGSNPEVLDFRFIRAQDRLKIKPKETAKEIYMNSTNLRYSHIKGEHKVKYDITIDSDVEDFAISFGIFLKNNISTIKSINIQGVKGRLLLKLIQKMCERNEISNITFFQEEEIEEKKQSRFKRKRKTR